MPIRRVAKGKRTSWIWCVCSALFWRVRGGLSWCVCGALLWCVHGALELLAKREAYQNKRDKKEPSPRTRVVRQISEVYVKRGGYFEDDRFHSVQIFVPLYVLGNTQNCVRMLLPNAPVAC